MKLRYLLILASIILFQSASVAQRRLEDEVVFTTPIHDEMIFDVPPVVRARDDENTYLISIDVTVGILYLQYSAISNETGDLVFNKELEVQAPSKMPKGYSSFYDIVPLTNGKTAIIMKHRVVDRKLTKNTKEGIYLLYARIIDNLTGMVNPDPIYISELDRTNYSDIYNVIIENSPDRKTFVMHERLSDGSKGKDLFRVFDENFDEIEQFEDESQLSTSSLRSMIVDNEGSVYTVRFGDDSPIITSYDGLLGYEKWEEEVQFDVQSDVDLLYTNIKIFLDEEGKLSITGVLEQKGEKLWEPRYHFAAALNVETKETEFAEFFEIDKEEIYFPLMNAKDLKKAKKKAAKKGEDVIFPGFFLSSDFFIKENGGYYYVLQEYEHYVQRDNQGVKVSEQFIYRHLLVFNVGPDGIVTNISTIKQNQRMRKVGYGSFAGFTQGDDLVLLMNMDEDNMGLPDEEELKVQKDDRGMISVEILVDNETGEVEMDELTLFELHEDAPLAPSSYYQRHYDNEVIIVGAAKRGGTRYVQLHLIDRNKL